MTYDVQRWELVLVNASGSGYQTRQAANGQWVLAADAEAHEKAAVAAVILDHHKDCYNRPFDEASRLWREQAIRDCIDFINKYIADTHSKHANDISCARCDIEAVLKTVCSSLEKI